MITFVSRIYIHGTLFIYLLPPYLFTPYKLHIFNFSFIIIACKQYVLVTFFLLLWRDNMTKATYRKVYWNLWLQRVSPWPSWQKVQQQAGRHGPGAVANSLHLIHKQEAERALTGNGVGFWKLKVHPRWHISSMKATALSKQYYQWRTKYSNMSLWRSFSFKHMLWHTCRNQRIIL